MYLPTLAIQTHYFLYSLGLGVITAVIYDSLRYVREVIHCGRKPRFYLSDVLIFIIAAFLFEIFTLSFGYGKIRYYALLGTALGFILYINTLGVLTFKIERGTAAVCNVLFENIVLRPIKFLVKALKKLKNLLYNSIVSFVRKIFVRKSGDTSEKGEEER